MGPRSVVFLRVARELKLQRRHGVALPYHRAQVAFGVGQRGGAVIKAPEIGRGAQVNEVCVQL